MVWVAFGAHLAAARVLVPGLGRDPLELARHLVAAADVAPAAAVVAVTAGTGARVAAVDLEPPAAFSPVARGLHPAVLLRRQPEGRPADEVPPDLRAVRPVQLRP